MNEVNYLIGKLPPFSNNQILIEANQEIPDIIDEVLNAHNCFAKDYDSIAFYFYDDDVYLIAKKIFDFCKRNLDYQVESENLQTTKSPGAILRLKKVDCKHYAGFIAGVLNSIERQTGIKINWFYRFASYKDNSEPAHVFVVINDKGKEIWIDPVLNSFDSRSIIPKDYIDYKIKNKPMSLKRISGVNETLRLNNSVDELRYYGIITPEGKVNPNAYISAMQRLPFEDANSLSNSLDYVKNALNNPAAIGSLFGDIWNGIKYIITGGNPTDSTTSTQALQTQLQSCQMQLMQANQNKNSFTQYLPLILIAGIGIFFLTNKR